MGLIPAVAAAAPTGVSPEQLQGEAVAGVPRVILNKEVVYNAIAIGAYELHDFVDFTAWLRGSLLHVSMLRSAMLFSHEMRLTVSRHKTGTTSRSCPFCC